MTDCSINPESNRTCERGTPKCEIHHSEPVGSPAAGGLWAPTSGGPARYRFLMTAKLTHGFVPLVIVRGEISGETWAFLADEFHDGRFALVPE